MSPPLRDLLWSAALVACAAGSALAADGPPAADRPWLLIVAALAVVLWRCGRRR